MAFLDIFVSCLTEDHVHNKLMTTICCDYLDEDTCKSRFRKFKLNSRLYLTSPREKNLSNAHDIWDCLERKCKLGVGDYAILKELTSDVDQVIIEIILAAEKKINKLGGKRGPKRFKSECLTNVSEPTDTNIEHLKQTLLKINNFIVMKNQISPLQKWGKELSVDFLYAPPTIREDPSQMQSLSTDNKEGDKNKILKDLNELFYKNGDPVRYIFMHGEAARGKTMYCKQLLKHWCTAKQNTPDRDGLSEDEKMLGEFDLAFLVSLRHVHRSRTLLEDMICYDTFRNNKECHDTIRHVLSSEQYKCLILVDGLDEWRISKDKSLELTHAGLPNIETFSACTCLFTLRPSKLDVVASSIHGCDRVVQILGLDEKGQKSVVDKVLVNHYGLKPESEELKGAKAHIDRKIEDLDVRSVLEIPLLAASSIMLWHEKKEIGNSLTSFYLALIQLIIRRAFEQQDFSDIDMEALKTHHKQDLQSLKIFENPKFKTFKEFSSVLFLLGEIAYQDLFSDEIYLVFDETELRNKLGRDALDFALKVGILSKCEAPGCFDEDNVSVNFFHKSVQEFLASFYIATTRDFMLLRTKISNVKAILDMSSIFVFVSGLSSYLASEMSGYIVRTANHDRKVRLIRETFNERHEHVPFLEALYLLQVHCYQEMKNGFPTTRNLTLHPITFHVGDIWVSCGTGDEVRKETVEIMTHHYSSTVCLYLWFAPSVGKYGITSDLLNTFLMKASSIQYLFLRGDLTINHINETLRLKSLHLASVKLPRAALIGLHKSIKSNKELRALTLRWVEFIEEEEGEIKLSRSLSNILSVLPRCPHLYMLRINHSTLSNLFSKNIMLKILFLSILSQLKTLRRIFYDGSAFFNISSDWQFDASVLNKISKLPNIEYISLYNVSLYSYTLQLVLEAPNLQHLKSDAIKLVLETPNLQYLELDHVCMGNSSLNLGSNLSRLSKISLKNVQMSSENWNIFISSLQRLNHQFDIHVEYTLIDDVTYEMIRNSSSFLITRFLSRQDFDFKRTCTCIQKKDVEPMSD